MPTTTFEEELARSGQLAYPTVGTSMLPLLREGRDVPLIESRERWGRPFAVGDAVLFRRPNVRGRGAYVLHRILRVRSDGRYWIAGDNCTEGELVDDADILGVMVGVGRADGTQVRTGDLVHRLYVALWCRPWPLRFGILRASRLLRRSGGWLRRRLGSAR